MATDPSGLISQILSGGAINGFQQGQQAYQDRQQQNAANQQAIQIGQMKIAAAHQQAVQQQQQQADTQDYLADPTPAKLASLAAKYPEQAAAYQKSYDIMDKAQKSSTVTQYGNLYNAAKNGRTDLLTQQLTAIQRAEQAQGVDTSDIDDALRGLASGNPDQVSKSTNFVTGIAQLHLAAADPDFAKAAGITSDKEQTHVLSPGSVLTDDSGHELYRNEDAAPKYQTIKNADGSESIVQLGGGDPASNGSGSTGGSGGPARRFGWTPRGPNSNAAVDNKIAGMSQSLGVGADSPFPANATNMQIAQALSLSEGGAGSLADRNNNPANLTDPKTGAYRAFPTKEAGLQAAAAQVARNRARGQNTIRSMVEGLPINGSAQANADNLQAVSPANAAKIIFTSKGSGDTGNGGLSSDALDFASNWAIANGGKVPPGFARNKQAQVALENAIAEKAKNAGMSVQQVLQQGQNFVAGQKTLNNFTSGPLASTVRSASVALDHLAVLHDATTALNSGNIPAFNHLSQTWEKATGNPLPTNASAIKGIVSDEINKAVLAGGGALADRKDVKDTLDLAGSPAQLSGAIRGYTSLLSGQLAGLQRQYQQGTQRNDFSRFLSPIANRLLQQGQAAEHGGVPTHTATNPQTGQKIGYINGKWVNL